MAVLKSDESTPRKPLRLWPGVAAAVLLVVFKLAAATFAPPPVGMLGGIAAGLVILLWWLFFSRARWFERVGALVLMVGGVIATVRLVHVSLATAGMGNLYYVFAVPPLCLALVAWAVATRRLSDGWRRVSFVASILLVFAGLMLLRTGGVDGQGVVDIRWRWTPTPEERLLAQAGDTPAAVAPPPAVKAPVETTGGASAASPAAKAPEKQKEARASAEPAAPAAAATDAEWPGFRGPARDGIVPGVRIATNWAQSPPVELWRRPIGPGWSSFAVHGDLVYTQEQRGDDEVVSCYKLTTGEPVWKHADSTRFWEANAGAGPRGTPTLDNGRVYTFGATGLLNALDAATGAIAWSRNVAAETGVEVPTWGFSSSPLVVGDVVVVAASGRLAAYDVATGERRWLGPEGGGGYSSPHRVTIDGVEQIVLLRGARSTGVSPADGSILWEHKGQPVASILQPALAADGDFLISAADMMGGTGIRRIAVAHGPAGWTVEERWASSGLKPYFNDFIVHKGHAFGFDGSILASIDLERGERKWKGGRYGHGQMLLLSDQDLLLLLSEDGDLALVEATPARFAEIARFPAIEGKTWNHPALAGDVLLARNSEEMAAFRLARASR